jgi:hypothetical protein
VRVVAASVLVAALLFAMGCASSPSPPPSGGMADQVVEIDLIVDRSAREVTRANAVYEEVVIEASRAYFAGELDEATFNTIKEAAEKVEQSIRAAKAAVEVYAAVRSPANATTATALLDALKVVADKLDSLWEEDDDGQ